ncbi:MAG: DNA-binding protein [Gammaproteobacteria bacterium]|nr:DNA-binding protein [Gammaproteobacteria bacterium]MCW8924030.1 DNA-binding protein [Gammaproteobacteria bacterium]
MKEFEFTLKFSLADDSTEPDAYIERLAEHGCDDALVGIGQNGRIALQFNRQAENALEAVFSAVENIKVAIPNAELIEATPDLVGLTDIADVLGFSRQNIRKLMLNNKASFPAPVHEGKAALWHLSNVLNWLKQAGRYSIDESLLDVAKANMQLNIAKEAVSLDSSVQDRFYLVGV